MAKTKEKSSKSEKQPHIKEREKQASISEFRAQLDALGLQIIQVDADGNCLFRAIADQLEGNEEMHTKYRRMVVRFIMKNREMFKPFIGDDELFDEYCQSMEKDGIWAGYVELRAASLVTHTNICIHQPVRPNDRHDEMSARCPTLNFGNREARKIHLSYDSEHYNSVRLKEDTCTGRARPVIIKADAGLSGKSNKKKAAVSKAKSGTGCCDDNQKEEAEQHTKKVGDSCSKIEKTGKDTKFQHVGKNIPRNKVCPCGSKKNYKSCCGTVQGTRSSPRFSVNQTVEQCKGRKDKKQGKKGAATSNLSHSHSFDKVIPDLGELKLDEDNKLGQAWHKPGSC